MAAAYQLIGQTKVALQLISGLPTSFPKENNPGFTFGSDLRDQAMVLETLVTMKRNAEANQLVKTVAAKLSQDDWYSTQTTAYSLIAIAEYAGSNKSNQKIIVAGKSGNQNININSIICCCTKCIAMAKWKSKCSVAKQRQQCFICACN